MGSAKRYMEEQQELYDSALNILVEVGAIEQCENHPGTFYDGNEDLEAAYKAANHRISKEQIVLPDYMSRRGYTDLIKRAHEDNSGVDTCMSCDKNARG